MAIENRSLQEISHQSEHGYVFDSKFNGENFCCCDSLLSSPWYLCSCFLIPGKWLQVGLFWSL
jgi:hypothetical protein